MINGKTCSGFEFSLSDDVLDDYELLEALSDVDGGNYEKIASVVTLLLGTEQKERLKEHVRKESGRVSVNLMMEELADIFNSSKKLKN